MTPQAKGLLITAFGALCVVPDSLFVRLIAADPLAIAFCRNLLSGIAIFLGVLLLQGAQPFKQVLATGWNGVIYMLALGASGVLFVLAVSLTSVANVVFIIASMPVFAALFSRAVLGERISTRMMVTIAAVMAGLAVIGFGSGETEGSDWRGDVLALLVSAGFAAGLTAVRRVKDVSMVPAVPMAYVGSALLILPFADLSTIDAGQLWLVLMHAAFIVASATLLALGPRYITSAEVALLILLESVLAPLLVWAVIGEYPGHWTIAGGGLVIGALAASNLVVLLRR